MISKKIQTALNEQLNAELQSGYLYFAMSAHLANANFSGMANWMNIQGQEEIAHAAKFYNFILDRDGQVSLKQIDAPPNKWASPLAVFKAAYEHEQKVTALIGKLVELAGQEKDHATAAFLQWFVTEQVEEEANALAVVDKLKLAGDHTGALFMMDKELGARAPAPAGGE